MNRIFASISVGLLCLLTLWWFSGPIAWQPLLILALCSAVMALLFHWALGAWLGWIERPDHPAPENERQTG